MRLVLSHLCLLAVLCAGLVPHIAAKQWCGSCIPQANSQSLALHSVPLVASGCCQPYVAAAQSLNGKMPGQFLVVIFSNHTDAAICDLTQSVCISTPAPLSPGGQVQVPVGPESFQPPMAQ